MPKYIAPKQHRQKTKQVPSKDDKHAKHAGDPSFSFRYLNLHHHKYNIEGKNSDYFLKLIARFQDVCSVPVSELHATKSKALRCHPFEWSQTTETCFGIPNEDQIVDVPIQFSVSANKHGRVMGFFIGTVFYVVWFDHSHKVFS
jgi:hypothetical protein